MDAARRRAILFVDDEPAVLRSMERLFRRERLMWDMCFVESGADALALLANRSFDVVVSDLRMPKMDGSELLRRVSAIQPNAKRIVLSGYAEHAVAANARECCDHFLTKPCNTEELRALLAPTACERGDRLEKQR